MITKKLDVIPEANPPLKLLKDAQISQTGWFNKPTRFLFNKLEAMIHGRFEQTLHNTPLQSLHDDRPLILFSDLHRADKGLLDRFAQNQALMADALDHYMARGYSYVELGDGDELWQVDRFSTIHHAYQPIFDRLKQFHHNGRLHMILGNHDIGKDRSLTKMKLGMPLKMGARFLHEPTGREIFLTYGHQADLESGDFSRLMLRYLAMPFQKLSLQSAGTTNRVIRWLRKVTQHIENSYDEHSAVLERRIKGWAVRHAQKIIVCGHTHVPRFADGNYFNTGSCLEPGALTGIEIAHGKISQIRWLKTDEGKMQKLILNEMSLAQ